MVRSGLRYRLLGAFFRAKCDMLGLYFSMCIIMVLSSGSPSRFGLMPPRLSFVATIAFSNSAELFSIVRIRLSLFRPSDLRKNSLQTLTVPVVGSVELGEGNLYSRMCAFGVWAVGFALIVAIVVTNLLSHKLRSE